MKDNCNFKSYVFGKRTPLNDNQPYHWEEVDFSKYKIERPTIICLGGNGTIDAREANGMAKMVQNMIGVTDQADIISVIYSHTEAFTTGFLSSADEKRMVEQLFVPLMCDEKGRPLEFEKVRKNFRNITVFAHCFGARQVWEQLEKITFDKMYRAGFDVFDVMEIMQQVLVVSYAPSCRHGEAMTFNVKSIRDDYYGDEYQSEMFSLDMTKTQFSEHSKRALQTYVELVHIIPSSAEYYGRNFFKHHKYMLAKSGNTINLYTDDLSLDSHDHQISVIARDENWRPSRCASMLGKSVSECVSFAIATSVVNAMINNEHKGFVPLDLDGIMQDTEELLDGCIKDGEKIVDRKFR